MTRIALISTVTLASLSLAACAVGPKAPDASLPPEASGAFISQDATAMVSAPARDDWWRLYSDPALDALVQQALVENNNIEAAVANLRQVRAVLSEARTARLPTTQVTASAQRGRASRATVAGVGLPEGEALPEGETYDVGLDVGYEIDLFGRVSSLIRAARADADAAEAALEVLRVSVAGETARAYADTCSANAQIEVAQRTIQLQSNTVDLTQRLLDAGSGNGLDVARARSALESSRATLPSLLAQREAAVFRLATLTGQTPQSVSTAARACAAPPRLSQPIPVGDGAQLLARRPDVRQAERQLAAAAARVNVATASLFPSISLGGSIGSTALDAGDLSEDSNFRFGYGPLISWTFPNIFAARARIEQASAGSAAALAVFDQTVLEALQETETALSAYANELDRNAALRAARDEAATAARLSRLRFDAGADSFLTVLDAERTLAAADATLAASDGLVVSYQVTVFKALAGGWTGDNAPAA
jgi:outer membrane protein, multidrug efflux system